MYRCPISLREVKSGLYCDTTTYQPEALWGELMPDIISNLRAAKLYMQAYDEGDGKELLFSVELVEDDSIDVMFLKAITEKCTVLEKIGFSSIAKMFAEVMRDTHVKTFVELENGQGREYCLYDLAVIKEKFQELSRLKIFKSCEQLSSEKMTLLKDKLKSAAGLLKHYIKILQMMDKEINFHDGSRSLMYMT